MEHSDCSVLFKTVVDICNTKQMPRFLKCVALFWHTTDYEVVPGDAGGGWGAFVWWHMSRGK